MAEDAPRRRDDRRDDRRGGRRGPNSGDADRQGRDGRPRRSGAGRSADSGRRKAAPPRGDRPRRDGAPQGPRERTERERPAHNAADLRASNRADQQRSPDIDPDVTGKELDRGTLKEVGGLEERAAGWVAKHLVMAGRYIDDDPELAFQHALAASRRGGRLARVREAVALTAYAAGEYQEALREFRTYRRMTGDDTHIAAQVDSERALGRHQKALDLASEVDADRLERAARVELAIVVSGVKEDLGDLEGAHAALQIPELDRRRGYPFSPRLFQRQADVLTALGREKEAAAWRRSVLVAERALGLGDFSEPEIMDVSVEPVDDDRDRGAARGPARRDRTDGRRTERAVAATDEVDASPAESAPEGSAQDAQQEAASSDAAGDGVAPAAPGPSEEALTEGAGLDAQAEQDDHAAPEVDPNQGSLFEELDPADVAGAATPEDRA